MTAIHRIPDKPRYRLPLSQLEADVLSKVDPSKPENKNLLVSWIGRAFRAQVTHVDGNLTLSVAPTGNLDFIPLGTAKARPEENIESERLVVTDLSGVVQKKLDLSAEINPAEVVDRALTASGLTANALPIGLKEVLMGQVVEAAYQRSSTDSGLGTYYYVSMTPAMLDSLTTGLRLCNWSADTAPGNQTANSISATVNPGETISLRRLSQYAISDCTSQLKKDGRLVPEIQALLESIQTASTDTDVMGIVIGVAVLQTKGQSEYCSKFDLGLIAKKGLKTALTTPSCEALRQALSNFTGARPVIADADASAGTPLTDEEKKQILISLHGEFARATYKTLNLQQHSSILAMHWIPVIVK